MIRVAMLSKWHVHAGGYANEVRDKGHQVVCVWDDNAERGTNWAKEIGCDFEPDLAKVLAREDVDAVIVDTETSKHKEVIIAAAKAGKHIFTEKTLAATKADALEMEKAIEESGKVFTISFPQRTSSVVLYAKRLIDSGALGTVNTARFRNAHNGASGNWLPEYWYIEKDACGGAMMDLGCHPMYIANYLLGDPARITSMYNATSEKAVKYGIEDNAVNVIEFKNKAIAIVETGFVTPVSPWMFEIYGTEGMLQGSDHKVRVSTGETRRYTGDFVDVARLPRPLPSPMQTWFDAIEGKGEVVFGIKDAIGLSDLLEKAYISHKNNSIVSFE